MISALATIEIYKPTYFTRVVSGETQIVRSRYQNTDDGTYNFPVTDSCERAATVMADDYVKLQFKLLHQIPFDAFSYIWYDGQLFFLKEEYRPTDKGSHFEYQMKFVSVANMLDKSLALRYLTSVQTDPEPEINMNGTLEDMATIVMGAIGGAASRLTASRPVGSFPLFYVYTLQHLTLADDILQNTALETFSFSGQNIADVLTQLCNTYQTEWWISQESLYSTKLHLCRCEKGDTLPLSDTYKQTTNKLKPYQSRGLLSCEYSQEWSNVPQILIPYGSERNITRQQALENVNGNDMYVSYGKQLRLAPNTTYNVKDREGNTVQVTTNALGAFVNTNKTGIETIKNFDDIYPRCHFRVIGLRQEGTPEHPIYTMTAGALKADGTTVMTYAEMVSEGLLPLQIEPNETLSVRFESGYLNGREFEVRHDIKEETVDINGTPTTIMRWLLTIVPEEGGDDGVSLPFGNFVPRPVSGTYEGDMFAIFHMVMPTAYVNRAREELAQAAYDELLAIEDTRPEVKCKTDPDVFRNETITLGQRVAVYSELFGTITYDQAGDIAQDSGGLFASRVTSFQHSLTKPTTIEFKLASACVEGRLASIEAVIADRTSDIRGLEQRSLNLSRRGWHDAAEMKDMLETLAAEMMLVGVEKNQFGFTMAIESVGAEVAVNNVKYFDHLHISAGYIQHTQEPYIKYTNQGKWEVNAADLTTDINGTALDATKPYYLYAYCPAAGTTATMYLSLAALDNADPSTLPAGTGEDYLLLGILSSEFLDDLPTPNTSYRVFNRSNGYTQIAGGTITTEQIQDPTRSLIIDFASNPPRIIAKNGAQIIGNITFISSDGSEKPLGSTIDTMEEEINKEIGGENLYTGVDPLRITKESGSIGVLLEDGKKYVVSVQSVSGTATDNRVRLYEQTEDGEGTVTHTLIGTIEVADSGMSYTVVEGHGGELELRCSANMTDKYYDLSGIMVQQGEKPTTYQPTYKYLAQSFEHDATKQVTDINGGLLATSLIKLRNLQGIVMAGISGMNDGIVLWGGGSYADALSDAAGTTDILPVLLTTDPYGIGTKLGIFKIKKDANHNHYLQVDDDGVPSIQLFKDRTASSVISELSPTTPFPAGSAHATNTVKIIGKFYEKYQYQGRQWYYEHYVNGSLVEETQSDWARSTTETKILLNENMTLEASNYKFLSKVNFGASLGAHQQSTPSSGTYSGTAESSVTVRLTITNVYTNEVVGTHTFVGEPDTSRPYSYDIDIDKVFAIPSRGTYNIKLDAVVEARCTAPGKYNTPGTDIEVYGQAQGWVTYQEGSLTNLSSRTVLCKDGFVYLCGGYNFTLRQDINSLDVRMVGLPETKPSTAGRLYTQTMTINGSSQKVICIS